MGNATVAHAALASWFDEDGLLEVLGQGSTTRPRYEPM